MNFFCIALLYLMPFTLLIESEDEKNIYFNELVGNFDQLQH
jgi:hypothetical protein